MKIAILGTAGTGKGLLAMELAGKLSLPCISAKKKIYDILEQNNYSFACGIQVEKFLSQNNRQEQILDYLIEKENEYQDFITDKSLLEVYAYVLAERSDIDGESVKNLCEKIGKRMKDKKTKYSHVFFCPHHIREENYKSFNESYQFLVNVVIRGLLDEWNIEYTDLKMENGKRVGEVMKYLN